MTQRHFVFKPISWYAKSRATKSIPGLYTKNPSMQRKLSFWVMKMKKSRLYCRVSIYFTPHVFLTTILHRGLMIFFFFISTNLLSPIFIWTFISLFYLDLYIHFYIDFPFLFGLIFPFSIWTFVPFSIWTFISLFFLDFATLFSISFQFYFSFFLLNSF